MTKSSPPYSSLPACPLCTKKNNSLVLLNTRSGDIVRCHHCGFYYSSYFNPARIILSKNDQATNDEISETYYLSKLAEKILNAQIRLKALEKFKPQKGSLLDVGAYLGILVQEAQKRGWQAQGIEPVKAAAEFAQKKFKLPVSHESLEEFATTEKFDAITLYQVLEHFLDPVSSVKKIYQLLKPEGILVIETPNINNFWFKILKSKWRNFIPEHFQFFDKKTLRSLLIKNNFKVLKITTVGRVVSLAMIGQQLEDNVSKLIGKIFNFMITILFLKNIKIKLNLGDNIIAFAQKI